MNAKDWDDLEQVIANLEGLPSGFKYFLDNSLENFKANYLVDYQKDIPTLNDLAQQLYLRVVSAVEDNILGLERLLSSLALEKLEFTDSSKSLATSALMILEARILNCKNIFDYNLKQARQRIEANKNRLN